MSKQYDVFLSYSHDDVAWVSKLHDDLIRCGVTVARDQGIQHGDLFPPALEEFMANSKAVALVISAASLQSPWVKQELSYAHVLASERVEPAKLIPVLLQGAPDAKALGFLGTRHWVDFRDEKTYAKSLQQLVSAITGEERPCPENRDTRESRLLWRLAYAFLRLDQLPSGGWARSLPGWYQTLENNSEKGRSRAYEYRVIGGMNLTCLGLLHYTRALCAVLGENPDDSGYGQTNHEEFSRFLKALNAVEHRNRVAQRAVRHILRRLNADGAIPDQWERTRDRDVLHTVFGIIVLLLAYLLSGSNVEPATDYYKALVAMCKYLERNGRDVTWSNGRRYEAHCAITFLEHLLKNDFFKTANANAKAELNKLPAILAAIREEKVCEGGIANAYPNATGAASAFLLNQPLLWSLGGCECLETDPNFTTNPLGAITLNRAGIVQCSMAGRSVADWGHTAEYWWAKQHCGDGAADRPRAAIEGLLEHVTSSEALSLTHGVSFSAALGFCQQPTKEELQELDERVKQILNVGATERNLLSLVLWIYHQEYPDVPLLQSDLDKDRDLLKNFPQGHDLLPFISEIKNLFIAKLQPGHYIPDSREDPEAHKRWENETAQAIKDTHRFFEDELSDSNTAENDRRLEGKQWFHLCNYLGEKRPKPGTWVLDLGYGSGAHAIKQFLPKGYQVDFFDYSNRIADQLKLRLQDAVEATDEFSESDYRIITPTNIEELPEILKLSHYSSLLRASYRLVFADAVLFHISKVEIPKILRCFYDLLSSDGLLFANFKVNDHTMIGIDGRFFEYYANYEEIQRMLEDAGFVMEDVTFTSKSWSMYGSPYPTQWAHFICTKRPKP